MKPNLMFLTAIVLVAACGGNDAETAGGADEDALGEDEFAAEMNSAWEDRQSDAMADAMGGDGARGSLILGNWFYPNQSIQGQEQENGTTAITYEAEGIDRADAALAQGAGHHELAGHLGAGADGRERQGGAGGSEQCEMAAGQRHGAAVSGADRR